ncbi:MAG: peptide/nickel transport system permease protein [Frankiales bacterium]|jgi:peptide/nickel transport system permease protein|nr:peptide/nickel transport system permease protein [Frankiales bacterium]
MRVFLRRLGFYLLAAVAAVTLDFFIPRMVPGDPVLTALAQLKGSATPGALAALQAQYGEGTNHAGLWHQYLHFWNMLLHGDLGLSLSLGNTHVTTIIGQHIWWTVILVGLATVISFIVGTLIGTLAAWRRGTWIESLLPLTTFLQAMPYFFFATLLVLLFAVKLNLFPAQGGYDTFSSTVGLNWAFISDALSHAVLPALTIVGASLAGWIIGMRNQVVTVADEDYVLLAEAAGLPRQRVVWYAMRNAILPQISSFALALSFVVGGSLLTEIVFSYPGIGFILLSAVKSLDYSLVQGIFLVITLVVLAANFIADIVYVALDPRTRQEA